MKLIAKYKKFFLSSLITTLAVGFSLTSKAETKNSYKDIIEKDPTSSYIFLFAERSSAYLDWSGPSKLTLTTLQSQISKKMKGDASSIGHAQIAWYCNKDGKITQGATGQTGQMGSEGTKIVLSGWGLSVLDTVFLDGYLESEKDVEDRLVVADKFNNLAWIAFRVKPENVLALNDYYEGYNKSGGAKNYGFPVDPLKFQGAGCTSFANASLFKSNIPLPISEAWVRKVKLPLSYMGKLTEQVEGTKALELAKNKNEEKYVSVTDFLFNDVQWAKDNEPHKDFYYYDPELFYESLVHLENKYRESSNMELKNPIRTTKYDEFQLKNKKASDFWYKSLTENIKHMKIAKIHETTGLIVDLE